MGHLHRCFAYQNCGLYPLRPPSPGNSAAYSTTTARVGGARWAQSEDESHPFKNQKYDILKSSHEGKKHLRSCPNVKQELTTRAVATIIKEADLRITAEACQNYINKSLRKSSTGIVVEESQPPKKDVKPVDACKAYAGMNFSTPMHRVSKASEPSVRASSLSSSVSASFSPRLSFFSL